MLLTYIQHGSVICLPQSLQTLSISITDHTRDLRYALSLRRRLCPRITRQTVYALALILGLYLLGSDDTNSLKGVAQPWLRSLDGLNTHDESVRFHLLHDAFLTHFSTASRSLEESLHPLSYLVPPTQSVGPIESTCLFLTLAP